MPPDDRPVADALTMAEDAGALAAESTSGVEPGDFADVLRRASQQPEARISPQDIEDAEALAQRSDAEIAAALAFGTLEDFLDDAAEFVAEQRVDTIPPMAALQPSPPSRRRFVAVMGLAASLALFVLGAAWLGRWSWLASTPPDRGPSDYSSAAARAPGPDADEATHARRGSRRSESDALAPEVDALAPDEVDTLAPDEVEPSSDEAEPDDEADESATPTSRRSPRGPSRQERLEALDAEARAAWRRGDLSLAQERFETLVRLGGRRSLVDVAYGDLFSLARQRGDTRTLRRYWQRYARALPRGRYIDEARAGLCRTAAKAEQRPCWEAYLRDRPRGTYRDHARDVLSRSE